MPCASQDAGAPRAVARKPPRFHYYRGREEGA